jgi:hypothetical protein
MAAFAGLSALVFVVLAIIPVVCWVILPFAIIGTKHRLDLILAEQRRTNVLLAALTKRKPEPPAVQSKP